jgi:phage-related protein
MAFNVAAVLGVKVTADVREAERGLDRVDQHVRGLPDVVGKATAAIGRVAPALGTIGLAGMGIQTVTGAVKGLGDALGLGLASEAEQVRAKFQAFTKDSAETQRLLGLVREEANKTPFSFQAMSASMAALLPTAKQSGAGIMDLVKQAEILAASNPLQGLEGASFALKEAVSGDFTSIIERFNLSRSTLNDLKAQGVPALEAVQIAMREMGMDADLVSNMAQTGAGRWSTFKDSIDSIKLALATPIFDGLTSALGELQPLLDRNQEKIAAVARSIGEGLVSAIQTAGPVLLDIGRTLVDVLGRIDFAAIARGVGQFVETVQTGIGAVVQFIREHWRQAWEEVSPIVQTAIEQISGIVAELQPTFEAVRGYLAAMVGYFREHWDQIEPIVTPVLEFLKTTIGNALTVVGEIITLVLNVIQGDWSGAWGNIKTIASTVWDEIKALVKVAIEAIPAVLALGFTLIKAAFEGGWNVLKDEVLPAAWKGIQQGVTAGMSAVVAEIQTLPGKITTAVGDLSRLLWRAGEQILEGLIGGITSKIEDLKQTLGGITKLIPDIKGPLDKDYQLLYPAGQAIMEGLIEGMTSRQPDLRDFLGGVTTAIADAGTVMRSPDVYYGDGSGAYGIRRLYGTKEDVERILAQEAAAKQAIFDGINASLHMRPATSLQLPEWVTGAHRWGAGGAEALARLPPVACRDQPAGGAERGVTTQNTTTINNTFNISGDVDPDGIIRRQEVSLAARFGLGV